jgi:alpha-beta hydrolase superfamily lysophospholipase
MIRSPDFADRAAAARRCRRWQAALVAPLLLLATCGPPADTAIGTGIRLAGPSPPGLTAPSPGNEAGVGPARFTDSEFIAADGARLPLRKWLPKGSVSAVILALHGFGDYSNAFEMPAQVWRARGIATYAYDQRGFGGAPGRGLWPGEGQLTVDAITASRILRRAHPGRPLFLIGESMGGAVAVLAATGAMSGVSEGPSGLPVADIDGVILSAPAVWGRPMMDFWPKLALFAGVRLFPDMILTGRGLRVRASDNIPMLRALARDPLVLKGARVDTVFGLVDLMDDALAAAPRLATPTLLMYGAHDQIVPRQALEEFAAHLPSDPGRRRRLAYYADGYHLLLRDLEGAAVAGDVASWILDRAAPLPSHADAAERAQKWPPPPDG